MKDQFSVTCEVTIRPCRHEDLAEMEWFGRYQHFRVLFRQNYDRYERDEITMLVADVNGFPAGQVWVDFTRQRQYNIGVLWALRVIEPLQRLGIGTRLMMAVETLLKDRGFAIVQLGVEKDNLTAMRLYESRGYQIVGEITDPWSYITSEGTRVVVTAEEWVLHKSLS